MSFLTCFWLLPQNEHFSRSPPSPMRATGTPPHLFTWRTTQQWLRQDHRLRGQHRRLKVPLRRGLGGGDTRIRGGRSPDRRLLPWTLVSPVVARSADRQRGLARVE